MLSSQSMAPGGKADAELVADALAGNRDAFAEIVSRYQTLVCSLAYSTTGDLARSEDLAQDTFIAVWRQLAELREPGKLRAWVCGIARHRIQDSIRSRYHEPTYKAQSLNVIETAPAPEGQPSDHAVSKDEAAIVWRALEQIPESFREPLILYHRENQSVAQVAVLLDLSEDAVKQRLVRGRKLLKTEVEAIVDGTLRRTAPGPVFTANVMLALPTSGAMAAKAAVGTAAAKGLIGGGIGGFLLAVLTSPITAVGVLLFERKRMRGQEKAATVLDERELLTRHRRMTMRLLTTGAAILAVYGIWSKRQNHPAWFGPQMLVVAVAPLLIAVGAQSVVTRCGLARIWTRRGESPVKHSWEYRSALHLLGCPFVHIRLGFDPLWAGAEKPVRAWIAIGHIAHGRLFAWGYLAIAPVSVGGFALGIVSVGYCAMAPIALGALAAGIVSVGGVAVGWLAAGVCAFGLNAASGLQAYAWNFALALPANNRWVAHAHHVNDAAANDFFAHHGFFSWTSSLFHIDWRTTAILFAPMLPLIMWEITWEIMKGRVRPAQPR
jgi:RNA polymerase sigma factor (sigma-70 family)